MVHREEKQDVCKLLQSGRRGFQKYQNKRQVLHSTLYITDRLQYKTQQPSLCPSKCRSCITCPAGKPTSKSAHWTAPALPTFTVQGHFDWRIRTSSLLNAVFQDCSPHSGLPPLRDLHTYTQDLYTQEVHIQLHIQVNTAIVHYWTYVIQCDSVSLAYETPNSQITVTCITVATSRLSYTQVMTALVHLTTANVGNKL